MPETEISMSMNLVSAEENKVQQDTANKASEPKSQQSQAEKKVSNKAVAMTSTSTTSGDKESESLDAVTAGSKDKVTGMQDSTDPQNSAAPKEEPSGWAILWGKVGGGGA